MSELINKNDNRATIRWKLLTGASALALTAYVASTGAAAADGSDHPQLWIELGGQLSRLGDGVQSYTPDFGASPASPFAPAQKFEKPALSGIDMFGQASFEPDGSSWIFSASIRYGRATKDRHVRHQTYPGPLRYYVYPTLPSFSSFYKTVNPRAARFLDTNIRDTERHTIVDFQAGKDLGLGLFGKAGSSTVSLGVRFAQFSSTSNIALKSDPDWYFKHKYYFSIGLIGQPYHSNSAGLTAERSFHGVGPSLSWSASAPFAGNLQAGELDFDWGVNAALLFGRQKTRTQHHTTVRYNTGGLGALLGSVGTLVTVSHTAPPAKTRMRSVTVPNVGGFAGISYRFTNAKLSLGYRADMFFGAIDGGIDTRKNENRAFYGPYASISVGLGD